MLKRLFLFLILSTFLLPVFFHPVHAEPLHQASTDNAFGYTVNESLVFADYWVDISGSGSPVGVSTSMGQLQLDDAFSEAIPLGFNFPFFENSYSNVYVSTNGFITFTAYPGEYYATNSNIPGDFAPNNIIAPFWDDFFVNTTAAAGSNQWAWEIYYKSEVNQIRIQWNQVLKAGEEYSTDHNTFQVILKNNGEIIFVYEDLLSSILNEATVGIEGPDGIDGIQYLFNQDGLASNTVIGFTYPGAGVHLKMKPLYQGAFLENQETIFNLTLINTGTVSSKFNLQSFRVEGADWNVQFLNENLLPFTDTNSDGIVDSDTISPLNSKMIKVKITSPQNAPIGEFSKVMVRATSTVDSTRKFEVKLQAAIAAPFLQGMNDNTMGVVSQIITADRQFDQEVNPDFTGATLSLAAVNDQRYLFAWEMLGDFANYKNIQFAMFNTTSSSTPNILNVEDNSNLTNIVWDSTPAIAAKSGGQIAVTYIRDRYTSGFGKIDSNLYFVWLDQNGYHIISPKNVSQNNNALHTMEAPSVAVNENQIAFLAWSRRNKVSDSEVYTDLFITLYDQNGNVIHANQQITDSQGDNLNYYSPMVTALFSNNFLLTYNVFDENSKTFSIRYQVLNQDGGNVTTETTISNSYGRGQDVVQLIGGKILLAWTNTISNRIAYVILDSDGVLDKNATDLDSPDFREMGLVSVTYDEFGHGILTWGDEDWSDYLYYALVDGSGNQITPPMRFRKGLDPTNPTIFSSYTGQGNAPIIGDLLWPVYLPILTR